MILKIFSVDELNFQKSFESGLIKIKSLTNFEKYMVIIWLLGPFIYLIERTPADIWLSILAIVFVIRSLIKKDWSYHDYRDFPIDDLKGAINYFIKKNYFVIRVGSVSEGSLSISNNKYFDYTNSSIKSAFMDCFLLSKCEMFFGGSSGICLFTASFRKPYFLINNCPLEGIFSIKRIYPALFKRIKNLKDNKILSIREMVDRDLCNIFTSEGFKIKNVTNINNTEDEIKEFAIEALNI